MPLLTKIPCRVSIGYPHNNQSVAPRCKPGTEQTSIGAINMHSLNVKCEVDADPPESIRFSWTYNNTRNVSPVRSTNHAPLITCGQVVEEARGFSD